MFCLTEASVSTDWFHNSVSENEIQREREVSHALMTTACEHTENRGNTGNPIGGSA